MTDRDQWTVVPLPDDLRVRRRIGIRLVVLALIGLVALIVSALEQ